MASLKKIDFTGLIKSVGNDDINLGNREQPVWIMGIFFFALCHTGLGILERVLIP